MKYLIALLFTIISVNVSFAQSFIIDGRVCDRNDKEDLVGATLRLLSLPDSALVSASSAYRRTVRHGEEEITSTFSIALPSRKSSYLLEITAPGYKKETVRFDPSSYGERVRRAELPPDSVEPGVTQA